jgi:plasmid stabilization system protein ParE
VRLVVASPAARDLFNAIEFYDDLAPGLGQDLVDAFDAALSQILEFPESGSPYLQNTRRTLLRRFPFSVVYRVKTDLIEVVALAHRSRKPDYWTERS